MNLNYIFAPQNYGAMQTFPHIITETSYFARKITEPFHVYVSVEKCNSTYVNLKVYECVSVKVYACVSVQMYECKSL